MESYHLIDTPHEDNTLLLDPLVELNVGDVSILPCQPPEYNPNWVYIRFRRKGSNVIHITAMDISSTRDQFNLYCIRQKIMTLEESRFVYSLIHSMK